MEASKIVAPYRSTIARSSAICILIIDYEEIHDSVRYHNHYRLCDLDSGSVFSKTLEVNTLELPRLPKGDDMTKLCAWLEFIRATNSLSDSLLNEPHQVNLP
jgi:hypothetical protein